MVEPEKVPGEPPGAPPGWKRGSVAALAVLVAAGIAYFNSFSAPLLFDDQLSIAGNPSIRHLWPPGPVLAPPPTVFSAGRPLLNLSLALNYAWGGTGVFGYHLVNLLIHAVAGCALFGLVRRTLLLPALREKWGELAWPTALVVALLWTLHPVQTESVTYLSQRAESLMGCCALLTLWCVVRSATAETAAAEKRWTVAAVIACFLGMASKEGMVAAPLVVLLYDRSFLADTEEPAGAGRGTFAGALRRRRGLYAGLAASWVLLAWLMAGSGLATRDVGFRGTFTLVTWIETEIPVILRYLRLAVWPSGLVFDYGLEMQPDTGTLLACGVALAALLAGTVIALGRWPRWGFLAAWFFLFLAPTSSFVPVQAQPMAESRLYLPLAGVIALVVCAAAGRSRRALVVFGALAVGCLALTIRRNEVYRSELSVWADAVEKRPGSSRAHNTHGVLLLDLGPARRAEARAEFEAALGIRPDFANAHYNLGLCLSEPPVADLPRAISEYEAALRLNPAYAEAHNNLGLLLARDPARAADALAHYRRAVELRPDFAAGHNNLAGLLARDPAKTPEAIAQYEAALRANPDLTEAHYNLANLLAADPAPARRADRIAHYEAALRLNPALDGAHTNLGVIFSEMPDRQADAIRHFEAALRLRPDSVEAHYDLATTLLATGGSREQAIAHFQAALRLQPHLDDAREMLRQLGAPGGAK